jgi:exopolysaccharide production protein ExoZ
MPSSTEAKIDVRTTKAKADFHRANLILIILCQYDSMSTSHPKVQLRSIQILRGLAAVLVVLVHAINAADFQARSENGSGQFAKISSFFNFNEFGASGVDLFFVISGFVMALILRQHSDRKITEFAWNRFVRIVPFFWILGISYIGFSYWIGLPVNMHGVLNTYLIVPLSDFGVYSAPTLIVGWSLAFEILFYTLVAICIKMTAQKRHVFLLLLLLIASASGILIRFPVGILSILFNPIMIEFALGVVVFMLYEKYRVKPIAPRIGGLLLILGAIFLLSTIFINPNLDARFEVLVSGETGFQRSAIWGAPWALVVTGMLLREAAHPIRSSLSRFMSLMGDASYAIYLVHLFVCMYVERAMVIDGVDPDILVLSICAASILSGIVLHFCVEKPIMRIIRNVANPRSTMMTPAQSVASIS